MIAMNPIDFIQLPIVQFGIVAAAALQVADRAGPAGQPLAEFARAAFVHGSGQATLSLAALTAAGALVLAVFAPGRRSRTTATAGDGRR